MDLYFYTEYMFDNGFYYQVNNGDGLLFFADTVNRDAFYLQNNHILTIYNDFRDYEDIATITNIEEVQFCRNNGTGELYFFTSDGVNDCTFDEGSLFFYCDNPTLTSINNNFTVNGIKVIDNSGLPIFEQLNNAVDYIFFNGENPNTVLFETNGTLFDFQITTSTITYALSITAIILSAVGVAMFIKGIFNLIRGR